MPESYAVNWPGNWSGDVSSEIAQAQQIFTAARAREQERQRRAEQEQYERAQAQMDSERQAARDAQETQKFEWETRDAKIKMDEQKLRMAKLKHEMTTAEAMRQGSEFLAAEPAAAAHQEAYFAPGEQPGEQAPPGGLPNAPAQVQIPAIPGIEPGEPDIVAARTVSPFQMARAALEAKKAADEAEGLTSGRLTRDEKGGLLPASVVNARENAAQRAETARLNRENAAAIAGANRVAHEAGSGMSESLINDINRLPDSWRGWNASYATRDAFSVRNSEQAMAVATANASGKVLPNKKQGDAAIAAKSTLADIGQAQTLLADPEVRKYIGRYEGKMTDFLAKGWADPWGGESKVPTKVRKFRANLNRLAAEERHRIYGSALTAVESKYAEGFLPALDQPGLTIDAALSEYADDLGRGMDAMWGTQPNATAPKAGTGQIDPEVEKRLKALGY